MIFQTRTWDSRSGFWRKWAAFWWRNQQNWEGVGENEILWNWLYNDFGKSSFQDAQKWVIVRWVQMCESCMFSHTLCLEIESTASIINGTAYWCRVTLKSQPVYWCRVTLKSQNKIFWIPLALNCLFALLKSCKRFYVTIFPILKIWGAPRTCLHPHSLSKSIMNLFWIMNFCHHHYTCNHFCSFMNQIEVVKFKLES